MGFSDNFNITGTKIAYYIICKRKLWLFSHYIALEGFSDLVTIGRIISEESYKRVQTKEIEVMDCLKIDFIKIGDEIVVNEVKKSRKLEDAHIWQVKYYIYKLRQCGVNCSSGMIRYPRLFKKIDVSFTNEDESRIKEAEKQISQLVSMKIPPTTINRSYCRRCSYFEFCYI